jgi:hypothetical protein
MSNKYQSLSCDISELESRMRSSKNKDEFRRFQVVWLRASKGLSVSEIAAATCYSVSWIRQLHSIYRHDGIDAIALSEKGGRRNENMGSWRLRVEFVKGVHLYWLYCRMSKDFKL